MSVCCAPEPPVPLSSKSTNDYDSGCFSSEYVSQCNDLVDPGRACGEPLKAQRIIIDFEPNENDNFIAEEKCCGFWNFVKENVELNKIVVDPSKELWKNPNAGPDDVKSDISTKTELKIISEIESIPSSSSSHFKKMTCSGAVATKASTGNIKLER